VFNKYYQDELTYLRELGREFSQAYPALAPMLADRGGDPDVERLLEGVAFLTGRVRQKLDDELPELVYAIAQLLFPQLVRPLPGAAILEIMPLANALRERRVIPAATEFGSIPVDGTPCRFRSTAPCELLPWSVGEIRLEALPGGKQQLRIEFQSQGGGPIAGTAPDRLRLHLAGEDRTRLLLLMWLFQHLEDVVLIEPQLGAVREREISLGKHVLFPVGFEDDEALLPLGETAFPGFRLLQEYYVLPAKFAFVDVAQIGRVSELGPEVTRFALAFRFELPLPQLQQIGRDSVKLHCVPVVNVFETTAEPLRITPEREQFLVRPAGLPPGHGEVYAITQVETIARGTGQRLTLPWFFDFSHAAPGGQRVYYSTHIRPSVVGDGADMFLSLGTAENSGVLPDAEVLSIDLLATNGRLAGAVRAGEIKVPTASSPAYATFRNLSAVTQHVPLPLGRELQWRVTAHAAMNLRSLAEPEVLRSMLSVYNLQAIVDRQAARANELRVAALKDLRVRPAEQLYHGAAVRGVAVDIELDEGGFSGDGDLFLFGSILERFFASYVSLNAFSRTTVRGAQTKVQLTWPARSGSITLL
jgi:type VI secretion system protein ImpG